MRARGVGLMAALAVVVLSAPAVAAALSPSGFSDPGATPEQAVRAQTGSPKGLEPPVRHAQGGAPQDADEDELPFRYIQGIGDLNQDRVRDSLVVVQGLADASVRLEARAGTDGKLLWERDLGRFLDILPRAGDPNPSPWPVAQAMPDIDGDGVDDVLAQELRMESSLPPLPTSVVGAIAAPTWIHALSGRTGEPVWSQPVVGSIAWEWIDPRLLSYQDILTGWRHWMSDDGPRLLYKATDVTLINVVDPTCVYSCLLGVQAQDVQVSETLVLLDVAAGGRMIWSRDVSFLEDPEHTAFSWITGVVDVTGDQVADVIVDQELRHRPQFTELWEGVTGQPIYNYGRGMRVRAFDGSDGSDLWSNLVYDEDAVRVNTHTEEPAEIPQNPHSEIF